LNFLSFIPSRLARPPRLLGWRAGLRESVAGRRNVRRRNLYPVKLFEEDKSSVFNRRHFSYIEEIKLSPIYD
jgi:hypothetical protein